MKQSKICKEILFGQICFKKVSLGERTRILMDENLSQNLLAAIQQMGSNPEASHFIDEIRIQQPVKLFLFLSELIVQKTIDIKSVSNCVVIMTLIIKPTIIRPLSAIQEEFQSLDSIQVITVIRQAVIECLMYSEKNVRLTGAHCLAFITQIELKQRRASDIFTHLEQLFINQDNAYGQWASIGAISAMHEIITEIKMRKRSSIYADASRVVVTSCLNIMSVDFDPDLKIEALKCLKKAIILFIDAIKDESVYQRILTLIVENLQIDHDEYHQQLLSLLGTFLTKIYCELNTEIIGNLFTALIPDIASQNPNRQLHVIQLCSKIARFETELLKQDQIAVDKSYTNIIEGNFNTVFLEIIASSNFTDLIDVESTWLTPRAALDALIDFCGVYAEGVFDDCTKFYGQFINSDKPNIRLSALCTLQVISNIDSELAVEFIRSQMPTIFELCRNKDDLVRLGAFSTLNECLLNKSEIFVPENFQVIIETVQFGLSIDVLTAQQALNIFSTFCTKFESVGGMQLLGENYDAVVGMLTNAFVRPDALEQQFIEQITNSICDFIQHIPIEVKPKLGDLLTIMITHLGESTDDRRRMCIFEIIMLIVQALEDKIQSVSDNLISILLSTLSTDGKFDNLILNGSNTYSVILTISLIIFYVGKTSENYLPSFLQIIDQVLQSNSPLDIQATTKLIGNIGLTMGMDIISSLPEGGGIINHMFELLFANLTSDQTLPTLIPHLIMAAADLMKGITEDSAENPENARQYVSTLMDISKQFVSYLDYFVHQDFDTANSIAASLMYAFYVIIDIFPTEDEFICSNLQNVFIQVPIIVWQNKMITKKTAESFLELMLRLIQTVGRQMNKELNNENLQSFLQFAKSEDSPYPELRQTAIIVWKFYSDI